LNAVPELKTVANVKGEQVFQIASENMNNDYCSKLPKHVKRSSRRTTWMDCDRRRVLIRSRNQLFFEPCRQDKKPVVIVGAMRSVDSISARADQL